MNRRNRVAFFNILSTVLLRGISIFTAPLFTRLLGTSGYGVTQIYNTWVAVIAIVFTLQTQGTLVNARVEYPEGDQLRYQSSAMSLSTLVYLIFSALVLCFIGPISGALKLSWFLIVLMLIQGFGTFCVNFLNTKFVYEFQGRAEHGHVPCGDADHPDPLHCADSAAAQADQLLRPHFRYRRDLRRAGHSGVHLDSGEGEDLLQQGILEILRRSCHSSGIL